MCQECWTYSEIAEIVAKLDGADEAREQEIADELGVGRDWTYDLMDSRGYEWNDRWVKREFPART